VVAVVAGSAAAVPFALLLTPLDQAPSIAFACSLAAALALAATLTAVPALIALSTRAGERGDVAHAHAEESRATRALRFGPAFLARSWLRTAIGCLLAIAILVGAAVPARDGDSRPFAPTDLPEGSEPRRAATTYAALSPRERQARAEADGGGSLFDELPPAAALAVALSALALMVATRTPRGAGLAIAAPLPAAAAAGLLVLVFQEGHLASAIGQERQEALDTGALACALAALAAVGAARCAGAAAVARGQRRLGMPPDAAAETSAPVTLPATTAATVIVALGAGVMAGSDLIAAREFGLAVAAGLLLDLLLVRVPFLAAAARWGGR
jgi:uncharacterized membrane protein YdfJ with MMPL/SSD domain